MNLNRLAALIKKETRQMLRDKSNLMVGLLLPIVLILLFGFGLSFNIEHARVAVIDHAHTAESRDLLAGIEGSTTLSTLYPDNLTQAQTLLDKGDLSAIVIIPENYNAQRAQQHAQIQILTNGSFSTTAQTMQTYLAAALAQSAAINADRYGSPAVPQAQVSLQTRMWFNETGESRYFIVPGLLVLVMTLIGAFLTSLLVAREWERGTFESLFVTPVRPLEIVISKLTPYLLIGLIDLIMCLAAAAYIFHVPIRGSLSIIIAASLLYLIVSLNIGMLISAVTKNQFQASQIAMLVGFMPAMMLSGFVFDLRNTNAIVQHIGALIPATYYMDLCKTLFLAGDNLPLTLHHCAILALYAALLIAIVTHKLKKKL